MVFAFSEIASIPALKYTIFNNTVLNYITAFVVFLIVLAVLRVFKHKIFKRLKKAAKKTKNEIDDLLMEAVEKVFKPPFYAIVSFLIAIKLLNIPDYVHTYIYCATILVGTYYGIKFIATFIDYGTRKFIEKQEKEGKRKIDTSAINLLNRFAKAVLWIIAVILVLSNLGYDVTTLIAGLGIGGIAVAFALQNILGDIFASFSIYFDKPFETGDFIIVGNDMGTVEKIGIKSTRIRTLQGEELVISNKELTESRIHNFKKMKKRRVVFTFGVEYSTPTKKLKKIPKIIEDIIGKIDAAELDRVHFKEFGDFSLNFEVVYYVNTSDYKTYMDIQQEINLKIKEKFEKEGIEMAFPTQTIFLKKSR